MKACRIIAILFVLMPSLYANTGDSLLRLYRRAGHDTSRIRLLFQMGNQFFDGPSDSLVHYYSLALQHIEKQLATHSGDESELTSFRRLHFRALMELGIEHSFQGNNDRALDFYNRALQDALLLGDAALTSECYGSMGILYKSRGNYLTALDYYEKALDMAKNGNDRNWEAACYVNAGNIHRRTGNFVKALDYYLKALKYFEQAGEKRRIAVTFVNIGDLYDEQGDRVKAREFYDQALQISLAAGDNLMIMKGCLNMGSVLLADDQPREARRYLEKFTRLADSTGYLQDLDECYRLLGVSYQRSGQHQTAEMYFARALQQSDQEGDRISKSLTLLRMAESYRQRGLMNQALQSARESLRMALQSQEITTAATAYDQVIALLEAMGRPREALRMFREYSVLKDSLFDAEKYRSLTEMQTRYEADKKAQQLLLLGEQSRIQQLKLSKRNRLLIITGVIAGLVIVIAWLLLRQSRLKARHQAAELQHRLLRLQMDPHFIFNALIAIQSFIYKKDPVQAGDYLSKFADLMRMTLENTRTDFVPLNNEIRLIDAYVELQALRFEQHFDYAVEMDARLDPETVRVPPMLSQPFIENAIEHGLRHLQKHGRISVRYKRIRDGLLCTVEDNGVGRSKAQELERNRRHTSVAIPVTRERLEMLGRRFRKKFSLHITDLTGSEGQPAGTRVDISMPCKTAADPPP